MAQTPSIYRKPGAVLAYLASSDKIAGEVVVIGSRPLIVVSAIDFSANPIGSVYSDGVFDIPQAAEIIAAGDRVYWDENGTPVTGDALSGAATATAGGNNLIGTATPLQPNGTTDTAATDTYVRVDIDGTSLNIATVGGSMTADDITGSDSTLAILGLAAAQGGAASVTGGTSATTGNAGGAASLVGGVPGATGNGGAVAVTGGASIAGATGTGGAVAIAGGANVNTTNGAGGAVSTTGGLGKGTGDGGAAALTGGVGGTTGAGGAVAIASGASAGAGGTAGAITVDTGAATGGTGAGILIGDTNAVGVTVTAPFNYAAGGGAADVQTVTLNPAAGRYIAGMMILWVPTADNTGACTVNVNALGAKDIKTQTGADPAAGDLEADGVAMAVYDGTNFVLLTPATTSD